METSRRSILRHYSRPSGLAGMESEQIIGSCNASWMHFLEFRADYNGGDERKLGGDGYFDVIRDPSAWRGWTVKR
jgi:hypothetical protein